jgi:ACR3 family arsenite efflux pump ArsB
MDANLKKVLLSTVYYTLIAVMVAFVVYMFITLGNASMAMWEKVCLYILIGLLVAVVIYDIICTHRQSGKYVAGFILYIVTLLLVILSLIILALNSTDGRLLVDISERFFRIILFAYLINALAVLVYTTGEKLIVTKTNRMKK